jgi:hypothetical protein
MIEIGLERVALVRLVKAPLAGAGRGPSWRAAKSSIMARATGLATRAFL